MLNADGIPTDGGDQSAEFDSVVMAIPLPQEATLTVAGEDAAALPALPISEYIELQSLKLQGEVDPAQFGLKKCE